MEKFLYQVRNAPNRLREITQGCQPEFDGTGGRMKVKSSLAAKLIKGDGSAVDLGIVSRRVVTSAGVVYLADAMAGGASVISALKWHASGTGALAEAVGDTALGTEVEARVEGTQVDAAAGANATYTTVATLPYTDTRSITEHGIFSAAAAGTLLDRSVFAAIAVENGWSIEFTYTFTINSGN